MSFCPIVGVAAPGEIAGVASLEQPRVMPLLQVSTRHKCHRARRRHPALNPITINPVSVRRDDAPIKSVYR